MPSDERVDIEIRDKVSPVVARKLLSIAAGAREADKYVNKLKKSLRSIQSQAVSKLAISTSKAKIAQERLAAASARTAIAQERVRTAVARTTTVQQKTRTEIERTTAARARALSASKRAETASLRLATAKNKLAIAGKRVRSSVSRTAASMSSFISIAKAYIALRLAQNVLRLADAYTLLQNKLKNVSRSQEELQVLTNEIFDLARRTRTSVTTTAQAFQRFDLALKKTGASQLESIRLTETLNKLLLLSGATTAEQSSALLQLSQAFNEGRLRGQEFRIISQTMPAVLDKIAESAGVTRGELKKMGASGELDINVLRKAIGALAEETDERFAKLTPTLAQAWVVLKDSTIQALGEMNKAFGVTDKLSAIMLGLADNLVIVGDYFVAFSQLVVEEVEFAVSAFSDLWNSAFEGTILEIDDFGREFREGANIIAGFTKQITNIVIGFWSGALNTIVSTWDLFPIAMKDIATLASNEVLSAVETMVNNATNSLRLFLTLANLARQAVGKDPIFDVSKFTLDLSKSKGKISGVFQEIGDIAKREFTEAFKTDFIGESFALIQERVAKIRKARKPEGGLNILRKKGVAPVISDPKAVKAAENRMKTLRDLNRELNSQLGLLGMLQSKRELAQRFDQINNSLLSKKITLTRLEKTALTEKLKLIQHEGELQNELTNILRSSGDEQIRLLQDRYARIDELRSRDLISSRKAAQEKSKVWVRQQEIRLQTASTFFSNLSQLQSSSSKRAARIGKAAAITSATIDAYQGASGAFADTSGHIVIRAAAAAAALAAGLARVNQIRSAGSFAHGGVVGGTSFIGDNQTADVNSGEMILTGRQQAELFQMANAKPTSKTTDNKDAVQLNVTVENYGSSEITVEQVSANEVRVIARDVAKQVVQDDAPGVIAADLSSANSRTSKALGQNTNAQRRRG